jgi:Rad3-related DNA helicase
MDARESPLAAITFAMLIVDNYLPPVAEDGQPLSFRDRDLVIVDEGHNSEGQSSSLFAGFTLSPFSLPPEVYSDAGDQVSWNAERFEDIETIAQDILARCRSFIDRNEHDERKQTQVEKTENIQRKLKYALKTWTEDRGWVVNINEVDDRRGPGTTKSIEVKPVRVHDFLQDFVWSRGRRRLVTSATIPFRGNIQEWADRIGLDGDVRFIAKPTPFPEDHRKIHLNTVVGKMSGSSEDENWRDAIDQIKKIASHHEGENGLIHSVSYKRADKVGKWLGDNVIVHDSDYDDAAMIDRWQNSDADILVTPTMTQGVDLHTDLCRWQVLLKVPYGYMGDSRVSYLLNEENEWNWYMEEAAMDMIQAVGRAVRGPEPEEAASFYVIDSKFDDVMHRVTPPEYIGEAVTDDPPVHWNFPKAAPWRDDQ